MEGADQEPLEVAGHEVRDGQQLVGLVRRGGARLMAMASPASMRMYPCSSTKNGSRLLDGLGESTSKGASNSRQVHQSSESAGFRHSEEKPFADFSAEGSMMRRTLRFGVTSHVQVDVPQDAQRTGAAALGARPFRAHRCPVSGCGLTPAAPMAGKRRDCACWGSARAIVVRGSLLLWVIVVAFGLFAVRMRAGWPMLQQDLGKIDKIEEKFMVGKSTITMVSRAEPSRAEPSRAEPDLRS